MPQQDIHSTILTPIPIDQADLIIVVMIQSELKTILQFMTCAEFSSFFL
jgi:hypothetical protein